MNKILLTVLTNIFFLQFVSAQVEEVSYSQLNDIYYRSSTLTDPYIRERCVLDIYYPDNLDNFATVVWFHGGGLKEGNKFIPDQLKQQGVAVVAVNYRLHPLVKSPAYIDDAAAAVAWVVNNIGDYSGSSKLIFVSGHSAGGYLTSMIGLDKRWLEKYNVDADEIAGLIPYSGHTITHFTIRSEQGLDWNNVIVDDMAPLNHLRADAPPYIQITGDRELEIFGRYEEVAYMWRMMTLIGHKQTELYELEGFNHGDMAEPAHYILLKHIRSIQQELLNEQVEK